MAIRFDIRSPSAAVGFDIQRPKPVAFSISPPSSGGVAAYNIGEGLKLDTETNTLSVDTAKVVEADNTKPVTSAAVASTVGNIEILLKII